MKHEEIVQELQDVARQMGITVRFERGDFEGGYCILKAQKLLLINRLPLEDYLLSVLSSEMPSLLEASISSSRASTTRA